MMAGSIQYDRILGVACLVACPLISGLFLGSVATLSVFPTNGSHAFTIGALVGCIAFVANALAIGVSAFAIEHRARRRAVDALQASRWSRV